MVICGCGVKGILKCVSVERVLKRGIGSYGIGALCRFRINRVWNRVWWATVDVCIGVYKISRLFQGWIRALCSALHNAFVGYGEIDIFKC